MNTLQLPRAATNTATSAASLAIQRIRHPLQGRHLQVVRRTQVSPGFVRLTLAGPELAGFVSAGFDDHLKLILPSPGQDRPPLPTLQDGRPVFDGPRPTLRDYTPARFDAAAGELRKQGMEVSQAPESVQAALAKVGETMMVDWRKSASPDAQKVLDDYLAAKAKMTPASSAPK